MQAWQEKHVEIDLCLIGAKGTAFFKRISENIVSQVSNLGDTVRISELIGTVKTMLDAYTGRHHRPPVPGRERVCQHHDARPRVLTLLPLVPEKTMS